MTTATRRIDRLRDSLPFFDWLMSSRYWARRSDPDICDFMLGNPHEMPLPGLVAALRHHVEPQDKDWFAYKLSEPEAVGPVTATLRQRTGLPYDPSDVTMTNGALGAIAIVLRALLDPGEEIVVLTPAYFFYDLYILAADGVPVHVPLRDPGFRLDADGVEGAITGRTRAVLLNTPNNPTGRVFEPAELDALAGALGRASRRLGRPVFLLADQAYDRIVFDGRRFPNPAEHYDETLTLYTYGKTLLAPGQRLGWIALSPRIDAALRERLRADIGISQIATGFGVPNALLQHAMPDMERLSVDVEALQRRRDRIVDTLVAAGAEALRPAGTFYVLVRAPGGDDRAIADRLADRDVFVLPGSVIDVPGWVRISLTANDAMVERALPRLADAFRPASSVDARQPGFLPQTPVAQPKK